MGSFLSKIVNKFGKTEKRILMFGLDAAGKTSILYKLKLNEFIRTIPTIGFNVEEVHYKRITFNIWDYGGGGKRMKQLMYYYCRRKDAIIFVVDSTDVSRLACATTGCGDCVKDELENFLQQEAENAPLLIYANKQDLSDAVGPEHIQVKLELDSLCAGRSWHIQPCSALTGDGLLEGLEWLANEFARKRK
ncbi:Arf1i [Monocercomonoides exilis]|uniref:Arf1i n=1 Tax=Monocercomonoides exilis TaxID=2049356 RepID=UPI00355938CC|nr:Arf1i [Monocercomonoides exilis]|eukprot:MONOS_10350.1-p1 / transcript=MONOS_10350.1 / gene=MONOS_10350 / organism=Monocercomonoides_exilis_PA203 / gene_product=Arf1i / transcript_product=Arf1i / location=Mono_scaffold00466:45357-46001(-) / protein_length=191 / sequence_SO=supercontig / SO=protein_coding / is_pseudo=false